MRVNVDPTGAAPGADRRWQIVVAGGALTTLATLIAVFALARHGTNIMGWYANWVIPVGALLVGMCAASGYAIAARLTGLKMTSRLVLGIVTLLAVSYMLAEYEEYRELDLDVGFFTWFDAMSRAFSFEQHDGAPGDPFGAGGYFFRALELSGFVLGGVLVPLALRGKPYCEPCRTYKRAHPVAWVPGGVSDDGAVQTLDELFAAAGAGDRAAFHQVVAAKAPLARKHEVNREDTRVGVSVTRCPRCANGGLVVTRYQGHGKRLQRSVVATLPLDGDRVRALFD